MSVRLMFAVFALLSLPACAAASRTELSAFLANPAEDNFQKLAEVIAVCSAEACNIKTELTSSSIHRLRVLIVQRNALAIGLSFLLLPIVNGAMFEDIARELGVLADNEPQIFLEEANRHPLTENQFRSVIRMMSEDVIDNMPRRNAAFQRRIKALSSVKDTHLGEVRDRAISLLQPHKLQ